MIFILEILVNFTLIVWKKGYLIMNGRNGSQTNWIEIYNDN